MGKDNESRMGSRKRGRDKEADKANQSGRRVTDERFSSLHWDPRFSQVPKLVSKIDVDDRFKTPLQQNPHFRGNLAPVDRFGRPKKAVKQDAALERLYNIADAESEHASDADGSNDPEDDSKAELGSPRLSKRKGDSDPLVKVGADDRISIDQEGKYAEELTDAESSEVGTDDDGELSQEEVVPRGNATNRIAVIGLDWSRTRAVDIYASFQSFCPAGMQMKEVKVHPSKLGMERLALEATLGPQVLSKLDIGIMEQGIVAQKSEDTDKAANGARRHRNSDLLQKRRDGVIIKPSRTATEDNRSNDDDSRIVMGYRHPTGKEARECSESDVDNADPDGALDDDVDNEDFYDDSDDDGTALEESKLDSEARALDEQDTLRKYEEERLKYYYAVAVFDDVKTAEVVYEQCDGVEFESTGLAMDLRFVPADMVISAPVRDMATEIPDGYRPPNLAPSNLNNSKVKLSWDADAPDRAILKKKRFGTHDEDDINLKTYLAGSSESEDQTENAENITRNRLLLLGGDVDEASAAGDADMEMEVTFEPGLLEMGEEIVKRKETRDERQGETPWEARLRRMQERKESKRRARSDSNHDGVAGEGNESNGEYDHYLNIEANGDVGRQSDPRARSDPFFNSDSEDMHNEAFSGKERVYHKERLYRGSVTKEDVGDNVGEVEKEQARRNAELELLMMVDDRKKGKDGSGSLKDRLRAAESDDEVDEGHRRERRKGRARGRRRSERELSARENARLTANTGTGAEHVEENVVDVQDERFSGLFTSHLFALDPTHPKFKQDKATAQILAEKARRGRDAEKSAHVADGGRKIGGSAQQGDHGSKDCMPSLDAVRDRNDDIMKLAASVKAKSSLDIARRRMKSKVRGSGR
jgi:hypothetical protein